ncbi:nuclear transport factor 2 family protein [Microbacterium lushaniae]|nr:nuclear transport factor 2 family protein [Microbacterium lushaniae]KAA9156808.1 nuclear transport factor 2 family protein [Microbacterium lushaniae]
MDHEAAQDFASRWVEAWNAHDLDGVLSHFAEDAIFTSPVARQLLPHTEGVLRGKEAIRAYWQLGLERIPDLHFDLEGIYLGVQTVVINYRNHAGKLVSEVLEFGSDGLVVAGAGTYSTTDATSARPMPQ